MVSSHRVNNNLLSSSEPWFTAEEEEDFEADEEGVDSGDIDHLKEFISCLPELKKTSSLDVFSSSGLACLDSQNTTKIEEFIFLDSRSIISLPEMIASASQETSNIGDIDYSLFPKEYVYPEPSVMPLGENQSISSISQVKSWVMLEKAKVEILSLNEAISKNFSQDFEQFSFNFRNITPLLDLASLSTISQMRIANQSINSTSTPKIDIFKQTTTFLLPNADIDRTNQYNAVDLYLDYIPLTSSIPEFLNSFKYPFLTAIQKIEVIEIKCPCVFTESIDIPSHILFQYSTEAVSQSVNPLIEGSNNNELYRRTEYTLNNSETSKSIYFSSIQKYGIWDGAGAQKIFEVTEKSEPYRYIIYNFGMIGTGSNPSIAIRQALDTIKFTGSNFTADRLQLNQKANDLVITFTGIELVEVILKDRNRQDLDNLKLPAIEGIDSSFGVGNILFNNDRMIRDSFDVLDAVLEAPNSIVYLFNPNTVIFLNDQINLVQGLNQSNDIIHGLGGNDVIFGLSGDDHIYGDDGNDILFGNSGNNILTGGSGADIFALTSNGISHVTDFNFLEGDRIGLSDGMIYEDLMIETDITANGSTGKWIVDRLTHQRLLELPRNSSFTFTSELFVSISSQINDYHR
jgi:hypothetical protein